MKVLHEYLTFAFVMDFQKRVKIGLFSLCILFLIVPFGCTEFLKKREPQPEKADTTTISYIKRGLLLDTRTSHGLPNAKVSIHSTTPYNFDTILGSTVTDSNGFFALRFRHLKRYYEFNYVFEHPNPVYFIRTYSSSLSIDRLNDSTDLFYLHRKSVCKIDLKNSDGKQKNVMLFNTDQKLSKLMMNLRSDTTIYYLLQDYTDIISFDYFPQKSLQQIPVRGSTSGDTLAIEFKY